jgi:hypothetical protein
VTEADLWLPGDEVQQEGEGGMIGKESDTFGGAGVCCLKFNHDGFTGIYVTSEVFTLYTENMRSVLYVTRSQ